MIPSAAPPVMPNQGSLALAPPTAKPPAQAAQSGYVVKPEVAQKSQEELPPSITGDDPAVVEQAAETKAHQTKADKAEMDEGFKDLRQEMRDRANQGFMVIKEGEERRQEVAKDFAASTISDLYKSAIETTAAPEPKRLMAAA